MKPIHGHSELWQRHGLQPSPHIPCGFKLGDRVTYTNDYGVSFPHVVIGFAVDDSFAGRSIYHIPVNGSWDDAGWFPCRPDNLKLEAV